MPIEYDITRKMNPNNFLDVYFGEIVVLFRDVKNAPGIKNKFLYIIMPQAGAKQASIKQQVQ
jgi:hypothetical protein